MSNGVYGEGHYLYNEYCRFCFRAKTFLRSKEVQFEEIDVPYDPPRRAEMERLSARRTVPQIFIDGQSIGGYDDIRLLDATGGSLAG
jgi:glutaredoxin